MASGEPKMDKPEQVYTGSRSKYLEELKLRRDLGLVSDQHVKLLVPKNPDWETLREIYIMRLNDLYVLDKSKFESLVVRLGTSDTFEMAEKMANIAMEKKIREETERAAVELVGGSLTRAIDSHREEIKRVVPFAPPRA